MMVFAHRVAPRANKTTGRFVPLGRLSLQAAVGLCLLLHFAGVPLTTASFVFLLCAAILALGLPHGALDLVHLMRARRGTRAAIAGYIGAAALMYGIWLIDARVALVLFLVLAVAHFAEDWVDDVPGPLAVAMAAGLLTAPALFHGEALGALFKAVTGEPGAAVVADFMMMVAPVAILTAVVSIASMWFGGQRLRSADSAAAMLAMLVLPPLVGFTLFFGLLHSPHQMGRGLAALGHNDAGTQRAIIGAGVFGGLLIAALIFISNPSASTLVAALSASFVTLSVLTLPHMLLPFMLRDRPSF